jgi:serine phosphatase RsbU (regulator of sigma subunit)
MVFPASTHVGRLCVESRYLPSATGPSGDIHDVVATPFGVRLLIGDVMGRGPEAHQAGASVLGAWREIARSEPGLPGVAVRLHGLITRSEDPERFVTALLLNVPDSGRVGQAGGGDHAAGDLGGLRAELVCCGHPLPLLVRNGAATFIRSFPFPPLGLLDLADGWCAASIFALHDGDRLLLYTDGVSEARDSRSRYFPLSERAAAAMSGENAAPGRQAAGGPGGQHPLDVLMTSLSGHIADRAASGDDALMVLVRRA